MYKLTNCFDDFSEVENLVWLILMIRYVSIVYNAAAMCLWCSSDLHTVIPSDIHSMLIKFLEMSLRAGVGPL